MLEIKDYVIAKKNLNEGVPKNAVGVVNALNGSYAIVLFIGANIMLRVSFKDLKAIDIFKTGKGYDKKICNKLLFSYSF